MGVVKEKSETSIIMDEDEFNRSIEPILSKKDKVYFAPPDRDPRCIHAHLKVSFDDVIAEPSSTHSFDRIWIGSHAVFELTKYVLYKTLTAVLAIPLAIVAGILFAILSCIHIWVAMPLFQGYMVVLPSIQLVWRSLTDTFVAPLFHSMGRCLSSVQLATTHN